MIQFNSIQLSDKKAIDACLEHNIYRNCDFCFANMYAWRHQFNTQFSIINQTLFIKYQSGENQYTYMMPIGKMPLKKALELIVDDSKKRIQTFEMKGVTDRMWENIEKEMPDTFKLKDTHEDYEYLYTSEKLIYLRGKKLQSKRNHINRFKADNPNWEYFRLNTKEELEECAKMLDEWENLNAEKAQANLCYDYMASSDMIQNFHELNLCGGGIRTNGKIVAFAIGEQLIEDTFVVHVEKAFSEINGAYAIINQQFAENEAAQYLYINREEDMGLENLRKAKMSYQPDILLKENTVILK